MNELSEWDSFYVIIGSAAGALIGLQFVVMTLIADRPTRYAAEAGGAFATPTIVHFTVTLVLSALVRVPWHATAPLMWVIMGVGITSCSRSRPTRRSPPRRQSSARTCVTDYWSSPGLCCSCCWPAFTTRGTQSRITS